MLSWIVWLLIAAAVSGEGTMPFSKASYASAMTSPDTPLSASAGELSGMRAASGHNATACKRPPRSPRLAKKEAHVRSTLLGSFL